MRKLLALLLMGHRDLKKIGTQLERIADLLQLIARVSSPSGSFRTLQPGPSSSGGDYVQYFSDEDAVWRERWTDGFREEFGRNPTEEEANEAYLSRPGA